MKSEPISDSKRDTILKQLRKTRNWTCGYGAGRVRIWTRQFQDGLRFCWQVHPKRHVAVNGICITLNGAIQACNQALQPVGNHRSWNKPVDLPKVIPAPPQDNYRLPYADN